MQKLRTVKDSREIEFRTNESEGNLLNAIGTYNTAGGVFVPTAFLADVSAAMKATDPFFDPNVVTVINSTNAQPMEIGTYDDVANNAVQINEAGDTTGSQVNLGTPSGVKLGAYSFRTPIHKMSMEIFNDLEASYGAYELFAKFAGERMARGISKKMVTGTGGGTTVNGILTALAALSVVGVTATGSKSNTGGSETGATTIGSADIAALYFNVAEPYRHSPKCVWMMNDNTLQYLAAIVTIQGLPLVKMSEGLPTIMGRRVCVSPSLPNMAHSATPVLFGDFSYWKTRLVSDDLTRIRVLTEAVGLVENGLIGLQYFQRADGVLAFTGAAADSPISMITNA
jgi:HK97 family phage major capsid protein